MVLWWLGHGGAYCCYREGLFEVVSNDLPQSTRALLERGFETCAAAAASGGGGVGRSLLDQAAAALARLRWRAQGRCPRGGDHRAAKRDALRLAIEKRTSLSTISCFPAHVLDHRVMSEYSARGCTPLQVALTTGNLVLAERLLRRGDAAAIATDGIHPIHGVVEKYALLDEDIQLQALRLFLRFGFSLNCADGEGNPLVCRAASVCSVKVLELFFQHGVDIDTCDNSGRNLLHYASKANVDFLLAWGVDPNAADADGRLPVHSAAIGGHVEALGALLPHTQENPRDFDGNSPLHLAAQEGHATVVKLLACRVLAVDDSVDWAVRAPSLQSQYGLPRKEHISKGSSHRQMAAQQSTYDVNARNSNGCTALHLAMKNGHLGVSKTLLSCGADPQALDNNLQSVFDYVFTGNLDSYEASDLLNLLLKSGANPCHQGQSGRIALCNALMRGNIKLFSLLLQCGVRVDPKGLGEFTALHLATEISEYEFVKLLLAHGADPSTLDDKGETPLNVASGKGNMFSADIAGKLLEAGADPNHRDAAGSFPLHYAAKYGKVEAAKLLLEHGARVDLKDAQGRTALHLAACWWEDVVKLLLTHGADPSALDNKGETPLNAVCRRKWEFFSVTKVLLEAGADPNHRDSAGSFPLHRVAENGNVEVAELLLEYGARADLKNAQGRTALHLAAFNGKDDIMKQLLAHGADPSALDDKGETPLNVASRKFSFATKVLKVLLEAGANPNHCDAAGSFRLHRAVEGKDLRATELLLVHGALVDLKDAQGRTALHLAAGSGKDDIVKQLLARGADPSALDNKGETPLNVARESKREVRFTTKVIKMLLEAGADPNHRDAAGSFPLHYAVKDGDAEAAELLLEHGARADLEDAQGCTILHLAKGYAGPKAVRKKLLVLLKKSLRSS